MLKLKGIDGDSYKRWNMWFNPIIREAPYQFLHMKRVLAGHEGRPETGLSSAGKGGRVPSFEGVGVQRGTRNLFSRAFHTGIAWLSSARV